MHRHLLAGLLFAATATWFAPNAAAADLSTKAPAAADAAAANNWSGFYVGLGLGARMAVADARATTANDTALAVFGPTDLLGPTYCAATTPCIAGEPLDSIAFRFGPYLGYNWQIGQALLGIEGDWGFAKGGRTLSGMFVPGGNGNSNFLASGQPENSYAINTTWDASIRARVGFVPVPAWLVYAAGGAAWLHVRQVSTCGGTQGVDYCTPIGFAPGTVTDGSTRAGWTVGGGLEAMITSHWIVRAEYRYANFGTWSPTDVRTCAGGFGPCLGSASAALITTTAIRLGTHTANFGLAYKF